MVWQHTIIPHYTMIYLSLPIAVILSWASNLSSADLHQRMFHELGWAIAAGVYLFMVLLYVFFLFVVNCYVQLYIDCKVCNFSGKTEGDDQWRIFWSKSEEKIRWEPFDYSFHTQLYCIYLTVNNKSFIVFPYQSQLFCSVTTCCMCSI